MQKLNVRNDDFEIRRKEIANLSDEELKDRFWQLAEETVLPLLNLAKTHTSPSIERSVLLRMGFSSLEAKTIVEKTIDHGLMGKGAGHCVYRYAKLENIGIREAGLKLIEGTGWKKVLESFGVK